MTPHVVDLYAQRVVVGDAPAGKYHRLACARHQRDRARQATAAFPYRFDADLADRFYRFAKKLKHYKGRQWAGKFIQLSDCQQFCLGSLFGWISVTTGLRRFRTSYNEWPRKNGKSLMAAVVANYVTFFDGEDGSEGYTAATKRDQARIVFNDAKKLVSTNLGLKARIGVHAANLHHTASSSKLEPLSADYNSMDGLNPHLVVLDEFHALKDRGVIDVLETAMGARLQPVMFQITTAGDDPISPCGDQHDYACKILEGVLDDETFFAFLAHADLEDDPFAETTWQKANPHYGVSVNPADMRALATKAQHMPSALAAFKQKRLDLWVNASEPWLSIEGWRHGQTTGISREAFIESLHGQTCWAGVDLSSKIDLTAVVLLFPPTDARRRWALVLQAFTPAETLLERGRRDRAPYQIWHEQGWLSMTPGNRIDQQAVREALAWADDAFDLREIGVDPWNAGNLMTELQNDGFTEAQIIEIPQTFNHLSAPSKDFEADVLDGLVDACDNPLMTWMVANAVVQRDGKDNLQPIKKKSRGRIDGVVAAIMARKLAARAELAEQPWTGEVRSLSEFA